MLQVLPSPGAASEWPAFVLDPPPKPHNRSSLLHDRAPGDSGGNREGAATTVGPLAYPLLVPHNAHQASTLQRNWSIIPLVTVTAMLVAALAVIGILLRFRLRASRELHELRRANLSLGRQTTSFKRAHNQVRSICVRCAAEQGMLSSVAFSEAGTIAFPSGAAVHSVAPRSTGQLFNMHKQ